MNGTVMTAIRTGAASGAATDLLARADATTVAIFGAGAQAETQLEAVCAVRAIQQVTVLDVSTERMTAFADKMSEKLGVEITSVANSAQALASADIVCTATTSPTPLSHDEYELPREVRTVRVNRLKARRAMALDETPLKKKHSVFSQLQREMRGWSGATLRRGFVAKGHGGQKRAFKVKLVGEGVNDYSGPYREVFTDAIQEVTDLNPSGQLHFYNASTYHQLLLR